MKSKLRQATVILDRPAFDLVRASVNLVLTSALIALATSMKLPLSTTYVSFMVAMGSSLADKAWGRESAVYRVAGVLSVIGGWFITAFIAFAVSGLLLLILYKFELPGAILLMTLVAAYMYFSQVHFNRKEKKFKKTVARLYQQTESDLEIYTSNRNIIIEQLRALMSGYDEVLESIKNYDGSAISGQYDKLKEIEEFGFRLRAQSIRFIKGLETTRPEPSQLLLFSTDFLQDISYSVTAMAEAA